MTRFEHFDPSLSARADIERAVRAASRGARFQQSAEASGYRNRQAGGDAVFTRHLVLSPAKVSTVTSPEQIFAVVGVLATDVFLGINKPTEQAGVGAFPQRVSSAGNVGVKFVNPTAGDITPTASEEYILTLLRETPV